MVNFKKRYIFYLILGVLSSVLLIVKFDSVLASVSKLIAVSTPVFIALLIAYVLDRPVKFFQRQLMRCRKISVKQARAIGIVLSYLLFIGFIVGLLFILIPQLIDSISEFLNNFRIYSNQFQSFVDRIADWLTQYHLDPSILSNLNVQGANWINQIIQSAPLTLSTVLGSIATFLGKLIIGILVSVYLLVDKRRLLRQLRRVVELMAKPEHMPTINKLMSLTNRIFSDFVYVQATEALIIGSLIFILLSIFSFPYALMISTVCGVTVLVPVVGSLIGGAFGLIIMLFVSPNQAIWFLLIFFIVMQLDANLIYPHRVQRSISLPAVWAIISIIFGGGLFGVVGALLAVPIASIIYQLATDRLHKREYLQKQRQINQCVRAEQMTTEVITTNSTGVDVGELGSSELASSEYCEADVESHSGVTTVRHTVTKTKREIISPAELWQNFRALRQFFTHKVDMQQEEEEAEDRSSDQSTKM